MNGYDPLLALLAAWCHPAAAGDGLRDWPEPDDLAFWQAVAAAADAHEVAAVLGDALRRLAVPAPKGLVAALDLATCSALGHEAHLRQALPEALAALRDAGLAPPVLLKGAVRLADGLYPPGVPRFMRDLDLLLPARQAEAGHAALRRAGWLPAEGLEAADFADQKHLLPLHHPRSGALVELHRGALADDQHARVLPGADVIARARPVLVGEAPARLPDPADQLAHLAVHRLLHHGGRLTGRIPLRDLLEARLLLDRDGPGIALAARERLAPGGGAYLIDLLLCLLGATLPGPTPQDQPSASALVRRWAGLLLRAQRGGRLAAGLAVGGHLADRVGRILLSPEGRRRTRRGLADPAFYRKRALGLGWAVRRLLR